MVTQFFDNSPRIGEKDAQQSGRSEQMHRKRNSAGILANRLLKCQHVFIEFTASEI
jgi:hypothetical protein